MTELTRPMLASPYDASKARFPLLGSVKVDGIRCLVRDGVALSRSLKPIPNRFVQAWAASDGHLDGMDGELVVGELTDRDCFRRTSSGVMSHDGEPDFRFFAFDRWDMPRDQYWLRYSELEATRHLYEPRRMELLNQVRLGSEREVHGFAEECEMLGHEGVMLRDPETLYKMGRATAKGGELLKLKTFLDAEATIVGFEEQMHNANEAYTDEVGATARSSHQENMVPMDTLGALVVRGLFEGKEVEFSIGTGFSATERRLLWLERDRLVGRLAKYKYFPLGSKDRPRFPVFLGLRHADDL